MTKLQKTQTGLSCLLVNNIMDVLPFFIPRAFCHFAAMFPSLFSFSMLWTKQYINHCPCSLGLDLYENEACLPCPLRWSADSGLGRHRCFCPQWRQSVSCPSKNLIIFACLELRVTQSELIVRDISINPTLMQNGHVGFTLKAYISSHNRYDNRYKALSNQYDSLLNSAVHVQT